MCLEEREVQAEAKFELEAVDLPPPLLGSWIRLYVLELVVLALVIGGLVSVGWRYG